MPVAVEHGSGNETTVRPSQGNVDSDQCEHCVSTQLQPIADKFARCPSRTRIVGVQRTLTHVDEYGRISCRNLYVNSQRAQARPANAAQLRSGQTPAQVVVLCRIGEIPESVNVDGLNLRSKGRDGGNLDARRAGPATNKY